VPLGTLNHFARDLSIPTSLEEAVRVVLQGRSRCVDVAEVNGRVFINNSSLGIYPRMLDERRRLWRAGRSKWLLTLIACLATLRRFPLVRVRMDAGSEVVRVRTPLVFVGNNEYQMTLLDPTGRVQLDGGRLSLYVPRCETRWALFRLLLRALLGRLRSAEDFLAHSAEELWVETRSRRPLISVDGELAQIDAPLRYRIRPAVLRVLVPMETAS
jgi:diacylglycerol kinase family enzyme